MANSFLAQIEHCSSMEIGREVPNRWTTSRYYERELGAGIGPSPSMKEHFGYTEPFRRFVQREDFSPQAKEIRNTMPSWLPGDDYLTNFRVGDPYVKVDQGFARLPGAGYEAIHPELKTRSLRPA